MKDFQPDYRHVVNVARNIEPKRYPLYEHWTSYTHMEKVVGQKFAELVNRDNASDLNTFFKHCCKFYKTFIYGI